MVRFIFTFGKRTVIAILPVEGQCQIHPVKPTPCRQWPFFKPMLTDQPNWEVARNSCPALAPYRSLHDYLKGIRAD